MRYVNVPEYECLRCHYKWIARYNRKPGRCPKCGSVYWDKPIKRQTVIDANKKRWDKTKGNK